MSRVHSIVWSLTVVAVYCYSFFRMIRYHRRNKTIAWGLSAVFIFYIMVAAIKVPEIPDWLAPSLFLLFLVIGIYTVSLGIRDALVWSKTRRTQKYGHRDETT